MSDLTDQLFGKVSSDIDPFKKILGYIPGFKGYIERQKRRDADKLLRDAIADRIEEKWSRVSALQRDFISRGDIMFIDDLEAAAIKLRTFADRIRRAPRGYSSLFEAVKINEEELNQIYQYDASMLELSDSIARAIDNIEASVGTDGLAAAIRNLITITQQCIDVYNHRDEVVVASTAEQ